MDLRLQSQVQHLSVNADYACHCAGLKRGRVREGHFINTETKRALGALTPDCRAGIGWRRVGSSSVRKSPAVVQEGVGGTDHPTPLPLSVLMQIQRLLASGRGQEVMPCAQHGLDWAAPCCWALWERGAAWPSCFIRAWNWIWPDKVIGTEPCFGGKEAGFMAQCNTNPYTAVWQSRWPIKKGKGLKLRSQLLKIRHYILKILSKSRTFPFSYTVHTESMKQRVVKYYQKNSKLPAWTNLLAPFC